MDGYVAKPIQPKELFETIESLVIGAPAGMPAAIGGLPASEILDEAGLLDRVQGDRQLIKELFDLFKADCPRLIGEIRRALAAQDCKALELAAHSLKGVLGNFAAKSALETALKLERLARAGELDGTEAAFQDLEPQIEQLQSVLATFGREVTP